MYKEVKIVYHEQRVVWSLHVSLNPPAPNKHDRLAYTPLLCIDSCFAFRLSGSAGVWPNIARFCRSRQD